MTPRKPREEEPSWLVDAVVILVGWAILLGLEVLLVGSGLRTAFAGNWEIVQARRLVAPIGVAMLVPGAVAASFLGRLVRRATTEPEPRWAVASGGALAAAALGYGVSFGRHMQALSVRVPFVVAMALVGAAAGALAPWLLARLSNRAIAAAAFFSAAAAWMADVGILPHLYRAFHVALFLLLLVAVAASALAIARVRRAGLGSVAIGVALVSAGLCIGWAPFAAKRLALADNLRFVLVERTVMLARAVEVAGLLAPPAPLDAPVDDPPEGKATTGAEAASVRVSSAKAPRVGEIPRALDWTGRDILLLSVDALRADHVSAYGYPRPTTPNLDALAREGTLFEHAYCPTPHTSYSVTSMMTGKAMRPLMKLGLGADSETWAAQLRRYGYRTAAFYPPAVFYIDAERFGPFEASRLDFEYSKVQFSSAEDRVDEVASYLASASPVPLFLWVHLFEPHEPYVRHAEHAFAGPDAKPIDAYDSEVAYADAAIGRIVALVRRVRPDVIVVATADHGEEFGEHGGSYHGTSCYEEQVRVPLIIAGTGVSARHVSTVVQTIDLLPTVLSAVGIPRPARLQGRDLGPLIKGDVGNEDPGTAYAETEDYSLVARGSERLICARKVAACRLFDVTGDPLERVDMSASRPQTTKDLRTVLAAFQRDTGRYESGGASWPEPIRRGLQRDAESAVDAAALLDDADAAIRRKAAEVTFLLHAQEVAPQAQRALGRDEDVEVRKWCALALVRMGDAPTPRAQAALSDPDVAWRRRAALAFASRGDARGAAELAAYWQEQAPPKGSLDVEDAKELLAALARVRAAEAVPALVDSLGFVPLRPFIADALGAIGDARARGPLFELFGEERYETARSHEARALLALGARRELDPVLERFAGQPEPMVDAIAVAREARLLDAASGGVAFERPAVDVDARVQAPSEGPLRLIVLAAAEGGQLSGSVGGELLGEGVEAGAVHIRDLPAAVAGGHRLEVVLEDPRGILAAWLVRREPPPAPFDLGAADK